MNFRPNHYTKDKMLRFRRVVTAFVAGVYFLTNVMATHAVEKSLWEERRSALDRAPRYARLVSPAQSPRFWDSTVFDGGSTTSQPPSIFKNLALPFDVASAVLPYGAIGEVRIGRPGAPVVFLVQDVHGNHGAQKNIGGLLGELSSHGVTLTGVEGAWVPLDLTAYHRHPSPKAVSLVADALLTSGRLSGSEWAGLTAPHPPTLVGVESPDLYHANVAAARECVARRPAVASFLRSLDQVLQTQKERIYSPELKLFDKHQKDYHAGREGLAVFSRYVSGLPGADDRVGAQVNKFLKAMEWESRLSFDRVEAERRTLMDRLAQNLDQKALESLLAQAVSYRAGKQTNGDFFSYLNSLCAKTKISLSAYQSFADYMAYVGLIQSIHRIDLLNELAAWEKNVGDSLAKTPEERHLLTLDRDLCLLSQLMENEMSPEAWTLFIKRRQEIVSLPGRLRLFGKIQEPPEGIAPLFRPHEDFCRLAMERNGVLVKNFMGKVESRKATQAVLLTGGFHTAGLQSELSKQGCSTVVITPRIEKMEGKPLDVFARDPLPFDQLFAGKPISLSPELLLSRVNGIAYVIALSSAEGCVLGNKRSLAWLKGRGSLSPLNGSFRKKIVSIKLKNGSKVLAGSKAEILNEENQLTTERRERTDLKNGDSVLFIASRRPVAHCNSFLGKSIRVVYERFLYWVKKGGITLFLWVEGGEDETVLKNRIIPSLRDVFFGPFLRASKMGILPNQRHVGSRAEVSSHGLMIRIVMKNSSGVENGSAIVTGHRGDVTLIQTRFDQKDPMAPEELLVNVAKKFLFKGQGRILIRDVQNPMMKRAAWTFLDQDSFLMAHQKMGRLGSPESWTDAIPRASEEFFLSLEDASRVDMIGSLSLKSCQQLWPDEENVNNELNSGDPSDPKVEFIHVNDFGRTNDTQHNGNRENHLYDVLVDGTTIGTVIFNETPTGVWMRDILVKDQYRKRGYGQAVYRALAKRAALILNPSRNRKGNPVPFEGRNIENPWVFKMRSRLFKSGTMEAADVGTRWADEHLIPWNDWAGIIEEGSSSFKEITGDANVKKVGLNQENYVHHFNLRGELLPEIFEAAERDLLKALANQPGVKQQPSEFREKGRGDSSLNGLSLIGVGVPFDPLLGLTIATLFIAAMLFKPQILKGLKGLAPPPVWQFLDDWIPSFRFPWDTVPLFLEKSSTEPPYLIQKIIPPTKNQRELVYRLQKLCSSSSFPFGLRKNFGLSQTNTRVSDRKSNSVRMEFMVVQLFW
jgi:hypothetical protein